MRRIRRRAQPHTPPELRETVASHVNDPSSFESLDAESTSRRDPGHYSEKYFRHHMFGGWRARVRTWLERRALTRAIELAGRPSSVLDIPCGAGRFWPTLLECCPGEILAMDIDATMIGVAMRESDAA